MGEIKNPDENNDQGTALQPGLTVGASQKQKEIAKRLIEKMNCLFPTVTVKYRQLTGSRLQLIIGDTLFEGTSYRALVYACNFFEANGYKAYWITPIYGGRLKVVLHKDVVA